MAAAMEDVIMTQSTKLMLRSKIRQPPPFFSHLFLMGTGTWLTLGDRDTKDTKSQANNENINVSLVAALMLTIATAHMFAIDEFDWQGLEERWGKRPAGRMHEVTLALSFVFVTCSVLAMLGSVTMLIVNGELGTEMEASRFAQLMGLRQSMGYQYLMLSLILVGVICIAHSVMFSLDQLATWIWLGPFVILASTMVLGSIVPAMDALYNVKHAAHTAPPTNLDARDLLHYVKRFSDQFGVGMLSEDSLVDFISFARDIDHSNDAHQGRRGSFATRKGMPPSLSPATLLLLQRIVSETLERYVNNQMGSSDVQHLLDSINPASGSTAEPGDASNSNTHNSGGPRADDHQVVSATTS